MTGCINAIKTCPRGILATRPFSYPVATEHKAGEKQEQSKRMSKSQPKYMVPYLKMVNTEDRKEQGLYGQCVGMRFARILRRRDGLSGFGDANLIPNNRQCSPVPFSLFTFGLALALVFGSASLITASYFPSSSFTYLVNFASPLSTSPNIISIQYLITVNFESQSPHCHQIGDSQTSSSTRPTWFSLRFTSSCCSLLCTKLLPHLKNQPPAKHRLLTTMLLWAVASLDWSSLCVYPKMRTYLLFVLRQVPCKLPVERDTSRRLTFESDHYEEHIQIPQFIGDDIGSTYDWNVTTTPQSQLDGATRPIPLGKAVGGGSIINGMVWNRGNQDDYNSWQALGNDGWAWDDLLPYFKKVNWDSRH